MTFDPTSIAASSAAERLDPAVRAAMARATSSVSAASGLLALTDWALHLAASPGKRMDLVRLALQQTQQLANYAGSGLGGQASTSSEPPVSPDRRFAAPEWQQWPFNVMQQSYLLNEQWWAAATNGVWGVEPHHASQVAFAARQMLDMFSPANQLLTNPLALKRTQEESGQNLVRGAMNFLDDAERQSTHASPAGTENFVVGRDVAVTPGQVILHNDVMELIQYAPATKTVHAEPILIVPAWIMKYYILDLSPQDSLIKALVEHGHTVFCISWKNPTAAERDLGMDDYLQRGFWAALDAVNTVAPKRKVHAVGYCLGGTLLTIAAAAMARDDDDRLASMTLFAAQTDFSEPGELSLFIDESQVSLLEAQMQEAGYLTAGQMAGAFQMLRSYDLLWSRMVNDYLLGQRTPMNDLMAWNADTTRMPARMHSQYLRRLFLDDALSEGKYPVGERPVSLGDLTLPTFMVGTMTDHVAPWRSVHKLHYLSPAEITFVLTSGGHNAGIVNPPGHPRRHFQMLTRPANGNYLAPDNWLAAAPDVQGSWWPSWFEWLGARSGAQVKPPRIGAQSFPPLRDAPGQYVLEK